MSSIFTKIINGEIPSYKIAENDLFYAFLDINPVSKGHTLVVPKIEVDQFFDLSDDILSQLMPFCKRVSKAMQEVIDCERIGMTVIGLEVPHAHVHLIPISNLADMSFSKERLKFSSDDYETIAKKIRDNFK